MVDLVEITFTHSFLLFYYIFHLKTEKIRFFAKSTKKLVVEMFRDLMCSLMFRRNDLDLKTLGIKQSCNFGCILFPSTIHLTGYSKLKGLEYI